MDRSESEQGAMASTDLRIFLNYRRQDSSGHSGWLYESLAARFSRDRVFKDIDTLRPGQDFLEALHSALQSSDVILVVIGERWLSITDAEGHRRIDDADDLVRVEIEGALDRGIPVVPVLVQGASMPSPNALPETLRRLSRRQAIELTDQRWHYDVARLIKELELVGSTLSHAREAQQPSDRHEEPAAGQTQELPQPPPAGALPSSGPWGGAVREPPGELEQPNGTVPIQGGGNWNGKRLAGLLVGIAVAVAGGGYALLALTRGGGKVSGATTPSATSSATISPSAAEFGLGPGGVDCAYQIKTIPNGPNLQPPAAVIDTSKQYTATIKTSMGEIKVELFDDQAPCTVNSFVALANQGFFDGLIFHRVVANFVDQGGDPLGTGTGGPGYQFKDELDNDLTYEPGTLAMANSGPNTNGSQFFIVDSDSGAGQLQHLYTIFGKVTEGMDVVQAINAVQVDAQQKPVTPVTIDSINIKETDASPMPTGPTESCEPQGTVVRVTAQRGAFSSPCLAAPADTPFTIEFTNTDEGVPHNVSIYTDANATQTLFSGDLVTGPDTVTYEVSGLPRGTYFFQCNVHPTQMFGTFEVK